MATAASAIGGLTVAATAATAAVDAVAVGGRARCPLQRWCAAALPTSSSQVQGRGRAVCGERAAYEAIGIGPSKKAPGGGGGSGVLDRPPVIERTTPGRESEFDLTRKKKMAPPYRVLLHNDNVNRREYVVQVLMKVIPGMTVDAAVNIMQEAHVNGKSVVIVCTQNEAEEHCTQLRANGLISSIEPASEGGTG